MLASKACAVQILEVALSRLICCSRVCKAIRRAKLSSASFETPIIRPGIVLLNSSLQAKKAAMAEKIHKMDHKLKVDFQLLEHRLSHHRECLETLMRNIKKNTNVVPD